MAVMIIQDFATDDDNYIVIVNSIILYHGSPNQIVKPTFGLGNDHHDYGKVFYLTDDLKLAKEWAVCHPELASSFVHTFQIETDNLDIFNYTKKYIVLAF